MTRYWMAIAIPPPQRGKHCNTITTSTPAVPPVITTNVLSCATGSYNPRTGIVTKIQAFGVQTNTVSCNSTAKNFTKTLNYWEYVENNMWKQQKYNQIVKEMRRQLLSSYYRVRYTLLLYQTMGSCRDNALCRSLQANPLTVLYTQVLYHCTIANTGAVQVSENAKNKWVTNMTPPEKTSLKSATPSLNKVLDYSTLRGW